jgi:hypothetical protein
MHFAAIPIQTEERLIEAHDRTLATVGADGSHFYFHVARDVDNVIDTLQGRPNLELHYCRRVNSWEGHAHGSADEPASRPMIRMHFPIMGHVNQLRSPLPQQLAKAGDKCAAGANGPVRLVPEFNAFHAQDSGRGFRFHLANPDRFFRGASMAALLAGSEEHDPHRGSLHYMVAGRSAAPDRLVIGVWTDHENALKRVTVARY